MSLPDFDEAMEQAADRMPFSNGFEGDCWMERWCYLCIHEANPDETGGCPLVTVAMVGKTPAQWQEVDRGSLGNQYTCTEFEVAVW